MSRFDDELRAAAGRLADESMPDGILDEALDAAPAPRRLSVVGAAASAIVLVAVVIGIGWGSWRQAPGETPVPSSGVHASTGQSQAPTSQPVRHQVEKDGVRLTVELESDRAQEGVPMLATTTVENLGSEPIYHPTSGGCEWAVHLGVVPIPQFEFGRSWEGVAEELKDALMGVWNEGRPYGYYFVDAGRLPTLGNWCAMNLARGEIAPGASQTDVLAWRPIGPFGMPIPSGTYEVTATFVRIPANTFHNRDQSDDVSLTFQIEVEGSAGDYLMPGEAIDVVLADDRFQELLAEAHPERWIVPRFEYADERWLVWLPIGRADAILEFSYAITAEVDARTGALLSVGPDSGGASASGPPAPALRHQIEDQGIRLTVEQERAATLFGGVMVAQATVENIGADSIFWSHSSACPDPVSMEIRPPSGELFDPGERWDGEAGRLKEAIIEARWMTSDPIYHAVPIELVGERERDCTGDLMTSELAPGAAIEAQLAWDPNGPYGMPPTPGTYDISARFGYVSRGAAPGPDGGAGPNTLGVTVDFTFDVQGPYVAYLSPGLAMDRLLASDEYRALLADAPRERWQHAEMQFVDRLWFAVLEVSTVADSIDTIVGEVNAVTGEVVDVSITHRDPSLESIE